MKDPSEAPSRRLCGARNRRGTPCQKPPLAGRTRCILHGGKTPKGARGNRTHDLYSRALTEDEATGWDAVPLGDIDAEIRMCKIWLARAMELDTAIGEDPASPTNKAGMVLSEVRQTTAGESKSTDVIARRPDVMARIDRLLGRIAQLEKIRSDLILAQAEQGREDGLPLPWVD
ncbi:hypothetical protein N825_28895 [Skermanella stibiiresistens SB22]|uniref:Terminase small subunit n=1 Tax=Skermanella stibiiresistens SB22 TaxID=1385369 RepID=W9GV25_9PROT|nr:HGGxSTG domain-containing protein [Skermanella stibiiresistens]EWY36292.1 hypothetical protein N825_28895 [Skermanella stibiiresistens SB22]